MPTAVRCPPTRALGADFRHAEHRAEILLALACDNGRTGLPAGARLPALDPAAPDAALPLWERNRRAALEAERRTRALADRWTARVARRDAA